MLKIIQNNIKSVPKTLYPLVWHNIYNGIELNEKEYNYWLKTKPVHVSYYELIENGCILHGNNGYKSYYKNGKRNRADGPAIIWSNGFKEYWINGQQVSGFKISSTQLAE